MKWIIAANQVYKESKDITLAAPDMLSKKRSPPKNNLFAPSLSRFESPFGLMSRSSVNMSGCGSRSTERESHSNLCKQETFKYELE